MATYRLTPADIDPLLEGLAILGTGGGGSPGWGRIILEQDFARGREIRLADPDDVPDDALIVSGGIMGSVKTFEGLDTRRLVERWESGFELMEAGRVMARQLGRPLDYVIPFEVGGLNTPVVLSWAARLGIPAVDGDLVGRSAPETQMTSLIGYGISLTPMPVVDALGNRIVVLDQVEPTYADELGRWVVTRGGGMAANNHYPMSGRQVKASIIPRTVTLALNLGRQVRAARQAGGDPVAAAAGLLQASELFRGRVSGIQGEDRGGFYITNVSLHGAGSWSGGTAALVIKNETMALWVNGALRSVFPDLVCMLDPATGRGIMSVDIAEGSEMVLLGMPCHERLRHTLATAAGQKSFGGARYGHPELAYVPMEQLK